MAAEAELAYAATTRIIEKCIVRQFGTNGEIQKMLFVYAPNIVSGWLLMGGNGDVYRSA
jgi:hypothetical protein